MKMSLARRFTVCIVLLAALLGPSCGGVDRPSVAEWSPIWQQVVAGIPSEAQLGDPPDVALCGHALGVLRTSQEELTPMPDPAIEPVVNEWIRVAEDALFECPPSSEQLPDMAAAYAELARLEAEVAVVLSIDSVDK